MYFKLKLDLNFDEVLNKFKDDGSKTAKEKLMQDIEKHLKVHLGRKDCKDIKIYNVEKGSVIVAVSLVFSFVLCVVECALAIRYSYKVFFFFLVTHIHTYKQILKNITHADRLTTNSHRNIMMPKQLNQVQLQEE